MSLDCGSVVLSWNTYSPVDARIDLPILAVEANVKYLLAFVSGKTRIAEEHRTLYHDTTRVCICNVILSALIPPSEVTFLL
jgi:hypothetical protein